MAKTDTNTNTPDALTAAVPVAEKKDDVPRVKIFIPEPPGSDDETVKIDRYEHVTIGNETTLVRRGEHVEVTVPVFLQLRNKYPKL